MIRFVFLIIICMLLLPVSPASAWDVLVVQNFRAKPYAEVLQGFRSACNAGIHELVISELNGEDVQAEIRRRNPDIILAIGMDALLQVRKIKGKPIIYLMVLNPDSALHGESNITGISMIIPPEKQLSSLHRVLPRLNKVGLIYNQKNTGHLVSRAYQAAAKLGIELTALRVNRPEDFPELLRSMKGNVDAYWMLPDSMVITPESVQYLLLFSMQNRMPILTFSEKYLKMGAFMSLEINTFKLGRQAGEMAVGILSGTAVKDLPGMDAIDANLTINHKIADKLGIPLKREDLGNFRTAR
jgi:putative tryptophan/tyrosine transport system substrate-binding protein